MIESEVERRLVTSVRHMGGKAYKLVSPGNAGMPDRLVILPDGRVFFVELKTDHGRLSANQHIQIMRLKRLKQDVRVLYGMKDVDAFLSEFSDVRAPETTVCLD